MCNYCSRETKKAEIDKLYCPVMCGGKGCGHRTVYIEVSEEDKDIYEQYIIEDYVALV